MTEQIVNMHNYLDAIQLKEKSIEPETRENHKLTRNLQLGNITERELIIASHNFEKSIEMIEFPHEQGGFISKEIGERNLRKIEGLLVMSGSKNGFVRESLITTKTDQTLTDKSKKSFFGGFFGG